MNIAIILAGGSGSRLGSKTPKQFIEVLGRPVISYSIEKFDAHPEIDAIEIVCRKGYEGMLGEIIRKDGAKKVRWITEGGSTFQESVIHGIEALRGHAREDDMVLIHYGASPFVSADIISDAIRVCQAKGNASPAHRQFLLTASRNDGEATTEFVDRDELMCLNSPQALEYGYACWLYEEGRRRGMLNDVEPHTTSLMFALGETVYFSEDSTSNIKITTKDDLKLFEGWLLAEQAHRAEEQRRTEEGSRTCL